MDEYVYSDLVKCPNKQYHEGWETWRSIGNSTYRCDCGCEFEWYSEDYHFILVHGRRVPKPLKEEGWLENPRVQTFILALFITAAFATFFGFVLALVMGR